MAITDPSKSTATQAAGSTFNMDAQATPVAQAVAAQSQPVSGAPRTFGTLFNTPIGRYSGSESIKDLENRLNELFKAQNLPKNIEYKLIPLDNQNNAGLAFGVLVFCLVNTDKAPDAVAFHTLIIEATAPAIPPRQISQNGVQVEILNPPTAAWDPVLGQTVANAVSEKFRNKKLMMVDACVVPRSFNPAVQTELYNLAFNAITACSTEIDMRSPGFQDINLGQMQKSNLAVGLTIASKQETDDVGQPQRVNVEVVYQDNVNPTGNQNNGQYSVNTQERSTLIGTLGGFIDFSWAPAINTPSYAQIYAPQQLTGGLLPSHKFAPRLVLTKVNPVALATPAALLNLLAPVVAVVENMSWVQTFLARGLKQKWHDIGALNIEGNLGGDPTTSPVGQKMNTTDESFNIEKLYAFVGSLVRPGVAISMDVPDAGPQSWFLTIFSLAASGHQSAMDSLINAANILTAGNFGRAFAPGSQVFIDQNNRVHLGTYDPGNGVLEDIRNVDYLAVANAKGVENADILRRYTDTFQATEYLSLERRLDERARIIREVAPTVNFTGFATRVTFSPEFIQALWIGIKACGVSPTVTTHGMTTGPQVNRAGASFANAGLLMPGTIQAFNQGQTPSAQRVMSGNNFTNRW